MITHVRRRERALANYKIGCRLRLAIIASLSDDLLSPEWKQQKTSTDHKTFGHCVHASEALWHLLGGCSSTFRPYLTWDRDGDGHLFLKCELTGKRLDPTSAQYQGEPIPYAEGYPIGFVTHSDPKVKKHRVRLAGRRPSRKARIIIARVRHRLRNVKRRKRFN